MNLLLARIDRWHDAELAIRALQAQDADRPGEAGRVPNLIIVDEAVRVDATSNKAP